MRGLWIDNGRVRLRSDLARPRQGGDHLVRDECRVVVTQVGVCSTDLALRAGYMGFTGIPGHEFVGIAQEGPLQGQRVVGEINAGCGRCPDCRKGDPRHCSLRTVLGILGRPGAFAEELSLPAGNLHPLPDEVSCDAAVFVEPLAAAFELQEQLDLGSIPRALVMGDGRLGLLCAQVLALHCDEVFMLGRHPEHAELFETGPTWIDEAPADSYPLVVEATGDAAALGRALDVVAPRGTIALKTTSGQPAALDLAPLVIKEVRLLGSRCGPFESAIGALASGRIDPRPMIHARLPLEQGPEAFDLAARPGTLKVLVQVNAN